MDWPLFSCRLSHRDDDAIFALTRISQLILRCTTHSDLDLPIVKVHEDPQDRQIFHFTCSISIDASESIHLHRIDYRGSLAACNILQHLLSASAISLGWDSEILVPPAGRAGFQSVLHAHCRGAMRRISSSAFQGTAVTLLDLDGQPVQRFSIGQPLGSRWSESQSLQAGRIIEFTRSAHGETIVRVLSPRSNPRPMILSQHLEVQTMLGKALVLRVQPLRGRIPLRVVAWSSSIGELFP